jgi:hypothetical protein
MVHPFPARSHANYPWYTPGGEDKRWLGSDEVEEEGLKWVGGLMSVTWVIRNLKNAVMTDFLFFHAGLLLN